MAGSGTVGGGITRMGGPADRSMSEARMPAVLIASDRNTADRDTAGLDMEGRAGMDGGGNGSAAGCFR